MEVQNTYFLLRHGRSTANEADLIVSTLENGVDPRWGLTELGQQQAEAAGQELKTLLQGAADVVVYTSPFSRTVQTARTAAAALGMAESELQLALELRERGFGAYELQPTSNYEAVWQEDAASSAAQPPGGGESVQDVAARVGGFIQQLEARHRGASIVLVSHGDALSILAAVLLQTELGRHREHGLPNCGILRLPCATNGASC